MNAIYDIPNKCKAAQCARLLAALIEYKCLTTDDCREYLGISHPAGRVNELRQAGYIIETRMTWTYDHNEYRRRMAHYRLVEVPHA